MKKIHGFILLLFLLLSAEVSAQKMLTLNFTASSRRIRYQEGQEISFKMKGQRITHTGKITHLSDSSFLLNEIMPVPVGEIRMIVDYKNRYWAKFFHRATLSAGILYTGIGIINRLIIRDAPPILEEQFVYTGAGLTGGSFLFRLFYPARYRIGKARYLKVLDIGLK